MHQKATFAVGGLGLSAPVAPPVSFVMAGCSFFSSFLCSCWGAAAGAGAAVGAAAGAGAVAFAFASACAFFSSAAGLAAEAAAGLAFSCLGAAFSFLLLPPSVSAGLPLSSFSFS